MPKASKDIRKAINAFIHRVESLENAEDQETDGFEAEYKLIQDAQIQNKRDNVFSTDIGKMENNLKKNRYKDILPYDDHRVVLTALEGEPDSDYINASKLTGIRGTGGYIATQGPLAGTVNDFWRMVWEYNVEIIFMACRIVESGKIKCKQYWNDLGTSEVFGNISVFTEVEENIMSDCVRRNFRVTNGDEERHVIQFHYSGWPDHGIPDDAGHIRDMIGVMRQTRHRDQAPLLVHCSAGCGRTGAIIAIDYVWTLLEEGLFDEAFSLFDLICHFRERRMSMVQTTDQYALVNKVLKSLCKEWLSKMASHTYENVQLDEASDNDGGNQGLTNKQTSGETVYSDANSFGKNPIRHGNGLQGPELIGTQPSEGEQENSLSHYKNLFENEWEKLEAAPPPIPVPASGDKTVHRTIVQAEFASPTKQAQTSDLGGKKPPLYTAPYQNVGATTINGVHATVPPIQHKKPQEISESHIYSTIDKINKKSPTEDTTTFNFGNRKAFKAPAPPVPNLRQQPPADEVTYSVVNKSPLKSPAAEVSAFPAPQPNSSSGPVGISVYSLASEIRSDPNFTPYEEITFSNTQNRRNLSASSQEVSDGRHNSSNNISLSPRQLLPGDIPGFKERLPRVRGPKLMPQTWSKM